MKYCIINKEDDYSREIANQIKSKVEMDYDDVNPNLVISVGGDGTILKTIHMFEDKCSDIIIFGINTGHLGFITNFTVEEIDTLVNMINKKDYKTEDVGLIEYEIKTLEGVKSGIALNEITVINPPRTLIVDVYIDELLLEHFRGTGLCISSPFGSTAYNKSLHGCVVDPSIKAFQLTEIASINSNAYRTLSSPILLNENKVITIKNDKDFETWITVDNLSYKVMNFEEMKCSYSKKKVTFASNGIGFIDRLKRAFINS